jgi:hypothetical protein
LLYVPESNIFPFRTKKQYIWRYELAGKQHTTELFTSTLSGKKKVLQNDKKIFEDKQ